MFYWLYYTTATEYYATKPWVIWLGTSPQMAASGMANFEEIGPLDLSLKKRKHTWVKDANVMFIDTPVGGGFSYTNSKAFTANSTQAGSDLVQVVKQFLFKTPNFQTIPLFIFTESSGGKQGLRFAQQLDQQIKNGMIKCNFKGITLGNSAISFVEYALGFPQYLYATSMVDGVGKAAVNASAYQVKALLEQKQYTQAQTAWANLECLIEDLTNNVNFFNILKPFDPSLPPICPGYDVPTTELTNLMNGPIKTELRIIPEDVTWGGQDNEVSIEITK